MSLCAMLSALAAEAWKGFGIERFRIVELQVRFGQIAATIDPSSLTASNANVPPQMSFIFFPAKTTPGKRADRPCATTQASASY